MQWLSLFVLREIAASLAIGLGGVGGSVLATDLLNSVKTRLKAPEVLGNADLHRLTGLAIRIAIENVLETDPPEVLQQHAYKIRKFAANVPDQWTLISQSPSWSAELKDADVLSIPGFIDSFDQQVESRTTLTPELWTKTLKAIDEELGTKVSDEAMELLGGVLHRNYAKAVRELPKFDEKAFVGMQLMFFKTILDRMESGVTAPAADNQVEVIEAIQKLREWSKTTYKTWLQKLDQAAKQRHQQLLNIIDQRFEVVDSTLKRLESGQSEIKSGVVELKLGQVAQQQNQDKILSAVDEVQEEIKTLGQSLSESEHAIATHDPPLQLPPKSKTKFYGRRKELNLRWSQT